MDMHRVLHSGRNWLLTFPSYRRVCGTRKRQGKKMRKEEKGLGNNKKGNLLPKSP
jgi:hypothetical protein